MGSVGIAIGEMLLGVALLVFGFIVAMQLVPQLVVYGAGVLLLALGLRTLIGSRKQGTASAIASRD